MVDTATCEVEKGKVEAGAAKGEGVVEGDRYGNGQLVVGLWPDPLPNSVTILYSEEGRGGEGRGRKRGGEGKEERRGGKGEGRGGDGRGGESRGGEMATRGVCSWHHTVHTYIRTYIHTYIRTYVHTYTRTYIHTSL